MIVESGTYHGVTTGGPITLRLINNDAKLERLQEPPAPRGGHIDLAGSINYQTGIRQVLERASARETALRVAVGALAKTLLREVGISVFGYVREIGGVVGPSYPEVAFDEAVRDASPVYTLAPSSDAANDRGRSTRPRRTATPSAAWSRPSSSAARSAWGATPSGTGSSMPGSRWR